MMKYNIALTYKDLRMIRLALEKEADWRKEEDNFKAKDYEELANRFTSYIQRILVDSEKSQAIT